MNETLATAREEVATMVALPGAPDEGMPGVPALAGALTAQPTLAPPAPAPALGPAAGALATDLLPAEALAAGPTGQVLRQAALQIRLCILREARRAGVGHIGSALSVADIIAALYAGTMSVADPEDPNRDRFVMSKGHAALALYAALQQRGWLTQAQMETYCGDASQLGVHPERGLRGVDFSTGSLGQGLAMAAGGALAGRLQGSSRRVFALLSDGECNEGSVWESVMFAAHHELSNLVAVIDLNGQQALGYTRHVLSLDPMVNRWAAFGWDAAEVDGHDPSAIQAAIARMDTVTGPPHVLVARTTFGKGVSYMHNQIRWHYLPMNEAEYRLAVDEVTAAG